MLKIVDVFNVIFGLYILIIAIMAFTGITDMDCKVLIDTDYLLIILCLLLCVIICEIYGFLLLKYAKMYNSSS